MTEGQVEGIARVVAVEGGTAWLEPEPTGSCGGCMSASVCGHKAGTSRWLVARRFSLTNDHGLRVGERVVIGISEGSLLRASATAYVLPLLIMLAAGIAAQAMGAGDGIAALATVGGLGVGLLLARLIAKLLSARGELSPHILRRAAGPGEACHPN